MSEPPAARRRTAPAAAAVVVVGLALGGLLALLLADRDEPPAPDDAELRLALAAQYDLDPDGTTCVLDELGAAGALEGDLAARLVDDAVRGASTASPEVTEAVTACGTGRLLDALAAAGVPEPVATCSAGTLADEPAAVRSAVAEQPLAADRPGREAVAACALEHLAGVVESGAGASGTDARCVAGGVIERAGLEAVLVSIGALAVTAEVTAAATEAATACAAG